MTLSHRTGSFNSANGGAIFYQVWEPAQVRGVVALVHGYAEHSGRYAHVAEALAAEGLAVWAYDHRGHGRSQGLRAFVEDYRILVEDLAQFLKLVRAEVGAQPLFLLGHSMGGLVSTLYAIEHQPALAGLILSAPAFKLDANTPRPLVALSAMLSTVVPKLGVAPFDISGVSRDPAVREAYTKDPHNYIGPVKARTGRQLLLATREAFGRAKEITVPVLMIQGDADVIANPEGGAAVFARFTARDKMLHRYPEAYHEVLNEPEQHEALALINGWIKERLPKP